MKRDLEASIIEAQCSAPESGALINVMTLKSKNRNDQIS